MVAAERGRKKNKENLTTIDIFITHVSRLLNRSLKPVILL